MGRGETRREKLYRTLLHGGPAHVVALVSARELPSGPIVIRGPTLVVFLAHFSMGDEYVAFANSLLSAGELAALDATRARSRRGPLEGLRLESYDLGPKPLETLQSARIRLGGTYLPNTVKRRYLRDLKYPKEDA